jgi:DNA repair protein RecN (Recombination protein N)
VLHELRVENLLLIESAELRLAPGLNVLTGETGAGKTVLAHALDLLLGGRPRAGIVRPGADEAYVEGVFEMSDELRAELGERIPADSQELVLARRVAAEGRTRALINGRSATVGELRDLAATMLVFYGQHEHRKLTVASAQLDILDGFCGADQQRRRTQMAAAHARVAQCEERLAELRALDGARERELDLLQFELAEIDEAAPSESEEEELLAMRGKLAHVEGLRSAAFTACEALAPEDREGVNSQLAAAGSGLDGVGGIDPHLDALNARWQSLSIEADDLAAELRRYCESLGVEPGLLEKTEERLALLDRLSRKHGGSISAVLEYAEVSRARLALLTDAEASIDAASEELAAANEVASELAAQLHKARSAAAPKLAKQVCERLDELAMVGASFAVELTARDGGPTGADAAEFMIATNPGVPAGPLREIASGGELSRVMLALLGVANDGASTTLVFDEIDAGVGGKTARVVGERLRGLAVDRQVLCITHLPQIASLAERHFSIEKDSATDPVLTTVTELREPEVVGELVRMLGAEEDDSAALRHARELRNAA